MRDIVLPRESDILPAEMLNQYKMRPDDALATPKDVWKIV
jgi:hypothetical protein